MDEINQTGGYRRIFQDLMKDLAQADIASSAGNLGLMLNDFGEAEVPFLGHKYLVSKNGVRLSDGVPFLETIGSVLAHYVLKGSRSRPAGQFVTFSELAGPLFKQGGYSQDALEFPLIKRFRGRVPELLAAAASLGGRVGGESGQGSVSLIIELLPRIMVQLIFYDRDDEFPARATLLYDRKATLFVEFEFLAVLVTLFVQELSKSFPSGNDISGWKLNSNQ
jgi:hypothetical protein